MRLDDQCLQLYRLARAAWARGDVEEACRLYGRLRAEHGCELFYEVSLPPVHLMLVHPIGTVLGRATYHDYLCVYQNVGVGSDIDGNRPTIGRGVVLYPGAKVLGNTIIGNNVFITANTVVQNVVVPDNSVVFPDVNSCNWKPTKRDVIRDIFKVTNE